MNKDLERLIKYIRREDVAFFIGSGFSLKAGAPNVRAIIDAIMQEGGTDFSSKFTEKDCTLRNVSEAFVKECDSRNDLICILKRLFEFTPKDTSDQELLRKIPHVKQIFTTNYDTLIEDAYPKEERVLVTSNAGCSYTQQDKVAIYKIHGDITTLNDPDAIVITDTDYKEYFKNERFDIVWGDLKQAFIKKHVIFIGYSLEDDNVLEIIKKVRTAINNNMKGMFLIAPGMQPAKVAQLKKNSVTYIDGYAENILGEILTTLKDTVVGDFCHKQVSKETYEAFLSLNGNLHSTTTNLEDKNVIEKVMSKQGAERKEKIQFTILNSLRDKIFGHRQNPDSSFLVRGTNLTVPAYKLKADEMISFSHTINGITFNNKEDINSLLIAPSIEHMELTLKMKSIDFREKVNAIRYREDNIAHIDFEVSIFTVKTTLNLADGKINIQFNSKDTYTNNDEAIKWVSFVIGALSGKQFSLDKIDLNTGKGKVVQDVKVLQMAKRYYEVIRKLEHEYDIEFERYDNFSESNLEHALCLYHYYSSTGFRKEIPSGATVTFEVDTSDKHNVPIDQFDKDDFVMIESLPFGSFKLNGKGFNIPFRTLVFTDCKAQSINKIDKHKYNVVMKDQEVCCQVWCSDKQPEQIGNTLYLGNKRICS